MTEILHKSLLTSLVIFALGGGCTLVVLTLRRWLSIKRERKHVVRLSNPGNVPSLYKLHIEASQPDLQFKMFLGNGPLEEFAATDEDQPLEPMPVAEKTPSLPPVQLTQEAMSQPEPTPFKTNGNGKNVIRQGRTLTYGMERLSNYLPGELGQWLRQQGQTLGRMQRGVNQAVQMQEHVKRKTSRRLRIPGQRNVNRAEPLNHAVSSSPVATALNKISSSYAAKTLPIQPGECVEMMLRIMPVNRRYLQGQFPYQITSQQQPLTNIEGVAGAIRKSAVVDFPPISRWRIWLPYILSGFIILSTLLVMVYSIQFIWL